jgi:peptide/nickel transport system substrate-binding protein
MTTLLRHRSLSTTASAAPIRVAVLLPAILLATMVVACKPAADPGAVKAQVAQAAPTRGGTLVVATQTDIAGVNELISGASGFSQDIIERMFLDLFEEQPDFTEHPPTFEPRLAESLEWSDDRLALTVRLREGVTWSDGVPVTSEDVRWTWQAQTDPGVSWAYAQSKEAITDVKIVDDLTVRFHFARAYATQISDVNEGVVLPKHVWSQLPFEQWPESEDWFREHLVVNGPFTLASWRPQEEIVLERNEAYFDPDLPRLGKVVFRVIPERTLQVTQLLRGELDFVPRVDAADVERIEQAEDSVLMPYWHRQYTYLGWNTGRELFADPAVRRALTRAIDRAAMVETLYRGYSRIGVSPILQSVWAFNDTLKPWPYEPALAADDLAALGWAAGKDGVLVRDGQRFSFELGINATSRAWRDAATMIQEQLSRIGIEVHLRPMEFHALIDRMEAHDYDAIIGSFGIDTSLDLKYAFHTESIDDGYNFGSYSNPRVDELIEQVKSQLDPLDAGPMLREIQEILHREQPFSFLWETQRLAAIRAGVQSADPNPVSTYYNLRDWWIE